MASRVDKLLTTARTPVQVLPTVQPIGRKANAVASLLIAGLTAHIGLPLFPAAMAASGSNVMSFCVSATSTAVCRLTSTGTKSPGAPVTSSTMIVAVPGCATVIVPLVQSAPRRMPSGSPARGEEQVSGKVPVASPAISTTQEYSTEPLGIGSRLANDRIRARTEVQSTPGVQPSGRNANVESSFPIAALTVQ